MDEYSKLNEVGRILKDRLKKIRELQDGARKQKRDLDAYRMGQQIRALENLWDLFHSKNLLWR